MDKRKQGYGDWEDERRAELREKVHRGEALSHTERMSLAIDSVEEVEP